MKNTSQEPVLMANSQVSAGSSTTTQEVEYRDIGMILNVKPRIVGVSDIHMDLSFELSKIISQRTINGNQYPVPGVRSYEAPVTVSSGDSLAIGGLDEFTQNTGVSKVPILGDIPLLGKLFQHKAKSKPQAHLLIFVTARIQDDYARGVDRQRARHLPW